MPQINAPSAQPFTDYQSPFTPEVEKEPTWGETFHSGFALENDVANLWELHKRKTFPEQPNYNLVESLKARNLWEDRDLYLGAKSDQEVDSRTLRIARERAHRAVLDRAGFAGYLAMAGAGLVSPTSFIPLLKGASATASAVKTGLAVGTSVAAQEAVLFANQETRTKAEGAFSVAASTVLGTILGAAGYQLGKGRIEKMSDDMANPPREPAISEPMPQFDAPAVARPVPLSDDNWKTIKPLVDELDLKLPKEADEAITDFVGHPPGQVRDNEFSLGLMSAKKLENAYRDPSSPVAKQLETTFAPVREKIREKAGDSITLYRVQSPVETDPNVGYMSRHEDGERRVLSWSATSKFADEYAGVHKLPYKDYTESEIVALEKEFAEKGTVKLDAGFMLKKEVSSSGEYIMIYKGNESITDTDSVRDFIKSNMDDNNYYKERNAEASQKIIKADIALDDVVWITDRAGQREFIVKNDANSSTFIDNTGKLQRQFIPQATSFGGVSEVGAGAVRGEGGKLKTDKFNKMAIDKLSRLSPVTRLIQQDNAPAHMPQGSPLAREIGGKFSQAGLRVEGNIEGFSAAPGGNVENVIKGYAGLLDDRSRRMEKVFQEYVFSGDPPKFFPMVRSKMNARLSSETMNYDVFKKEVFLAVSEGGEHPNSFVAKAAAIVKEHIDELYEDGVAAKVFSGKEKVKGDKAYISHLWDTVKINSNTNALVKVLADHYQAKKIADFQEGLSKVQEKRSKAGTFIEDIERPEDQVMEYIEKFKQELQDVEDALPFEIAQLQLEAKNLREKARKLEGKEKADVLALARDSEARGGETLAQHKAKKAQIRSRLANLSTARVQVNKRFEAKLSKIERNEELQLETMLRGSKQAQKLLALISKGTDKEVEEALSKFKSMFAQTAEAFDNAEEQIVRLTNQQDQSLQGVLDKQEARMDRLDDLAEKIDEIDSFDRAALKAEVEDAAKEMLEVHANINARRAVRNERLKAAAQKLTPEEYQAKIDARKAAASKIIPDFVERQRVGGADKIDLEKGVADFSEHSNQMAWDTVNKLKGTERRLAYSDIVQDKRGVELARVLDIPASKVLEWLDTDVQNVMNVYTRTLAADNTIARTFGNADMSEVLSKLTDEQNKAIAAIPAQVDKKGAPLSKEAQNDLEFKTNAYYKGLRDDIYTLLERARGMRGIPTDPDAAGARLGRAALHLNNVRYMGGAAIASLPDPARLVQRHGLLRTFRDGFIPLITNFKNFQISAREARLAGTANELVTHSRLNAMTNVFEDVYRGTVAERGLQYASSRMGIISGLNLWTQAFQSMAAVTTNARLIDSIGIVMGEKASAKELKEATEFLASVNITPDIAETIWKTAETGGIEKVNGVWLPNTELWDVSKPAVRQARRAYRAALAGEVDDTIIKPGFERPSFVDKTATGRLLTQFKSFALSSTQKTVMAGLQQHDMAYVNGLMISLAMGALSYYLYAKAAGGRTEQIMEQSIADGNWELWADEAISRSGQTAIFDSAQRFANRVPIVNKFTSFSGGPRTKTIGGGLPEELLGPSFDLLVKLGKVVQSANPDEENFGLTRQEMHLARQLLPFQNLAYTRRLLDQIENASGDAFGMEGRRQ